MDHEEASNPGTEFAKLFRRLEVQMKLRHKTTLLFFSTLALIFIGSSSFAGIANTVHNLSTAGPGTIKAKATGQPPEVGTAAQEICIFCHTPHNAKPQTPLWNREASGASYTLYTSEYLYRMGYSPGAYDPNAALGTTPGTPGFISRFCLSCHDGTIALGDVYAVGGTVLGSGVIIAMTQGGADITTMPSGAANFGTNLTTHHPVGIKYDPNISISFGSGSRSMELVSSPNSDRKQALPIVYNISGSQYVECTSCHDPHVENDKFLRVTSGANLADKIGTTCTSCHNKTDWTGSVHQGSAATYSDPNVSSAFGTSIVSSLVCINCHVPHKGLGSPYLLRQIEETTCFQGASGLATETACHGSSSTGKNIQSVLTRTYSHPTTTISGIHTDLDVLYPAGGTPAGSNGLQWPTYKHAECVDCHNPHRAQSGTHNVPADGSGWYPQSPTNNVSNALKGVTGVEPSWPAMWSQPTSFTTYESAQKEYQICFKCHSYYALGISSDGRTGYTLSADPTTMVTDQAFEFNPNNRSAHPVIVPLNSQAGSLSPKALDPTQMNSPWTNVGNQTMYCSDCHGADSENSGDPKGPHGSSARYMLKGTGKYWPTKDGTDNTASLWKLNTSDAGNSNLFCKNCHPIYGGGAYSGWYNNAHSQMAAFYSGPCVTCHVAVPHGSRRSRLIGYQSDPAPYNFNGNELMIVGFKKATVNSYATLNCATACGGHQSTPQPGMEDY